MRFSLPSRRVNAVRPRLATGPVAESSALTVEGSREDRELRELLHRRLRIGSLLALLMCVCLVISTCLITRRFAWSIHAWVAVGMAIPAAVLWRRRELPLPALRRGELLLFTVCVVTMTVLSVQRSAYVLKVPYVPDGLTAVLRKDILFYMFPDGSYYGRFSANIFSNQIIILWGLLAVGYGVLIPNTWRRCAIFLTAIVLGSLLSASYTLYSFPGLRMHAAWTLFYTFFVMVSFAAIGLYGSHKISVLRRAVLTAREVGQYSLKQMLGKGGMGEVYLAHHRMLRRPCAVKLIRPEQAGDVASLMRFEREVQAMAKLTHPNSVEIYDYGRTEEGVFYYAMEYLPGLSVEELVRRYGPVPAGRAIHFLRQVCGALAEAHAAGLIHRDIKPANLLICERGGLFDVVKLLDFGLVQLVGGPAVPTDPGLGASRARDRDSPESAGLDPKLTQAGHILGTPAYMSPEQARNGVAEARSDIYSVGAVGYFLLSGQPPFIRASVAKMMKAHQSEKPTPLGERMADVEAELGVVMMKCLEKEPEKRYQSVRELEQALARCPSAAQWDGGKAQQWWEQVKPELAAAAEESASGQESAGSLVATQDATREESMEVADGAAAEGRSDAAEA